MSSPRMLLSCIPAFESMLCLQEILLLKQSCVSFLFGRHSGRQKAIEWWPFVGVFALCLHRLCLRILYRGERIDIMFEMSSRFFWVFLFYVRWYIFFKFGNYTLCKFFCSSFLDKKKFTRWGLRAPAHLCFSFEILNAYVAVVANCARMPWHLKAELQHLNVVNFYYQTHFCCWVS